jgi:death-on-curing protein
MQFLTLPEVIKVYRAVIEQSGGTRGIRDLNVLKSALVQPFMTFDGEELYPTLVEKVAAMGFSLIQGHPFLDGNKRVGHAVMEINLILNGLEIKASVDEQEKIILQVASSQLDRKAFTNWLKLHVIECHKFD